MRQSWFCNLLVLIIYTDIRISLCSEFNIVNITQGRLQGFYDIVNGYWSFKGVPYAEFKGRFQEPGDPPRWNGTLKANRNDLSCIQYSATMMKVIGEEDCLTLNIYTPKLPSNISKPLSVIIYIHGGGFFSGSNSDDVLNPRYLVKKEVIVVMINYRLGAFGFLCLKNNGAAGNMGLKDQLAALKWVKNNIASFGGDPESITLFGESVGGTSVDYLILSQTAKGLVQRAIIDSGNTLTPQAFDNNPIATASEAASRLGYETIDTEELLKIFLNTTANDVAKISFMDKTNNPLAQYVFRPCKENPNTSNMPILTDNPQNLNRYICNISIMINYNNKEGIFWASTYDKSGLKMLAKNFSSAIPDIYTRKRPELTAHLINDIRTFYFNNASTEYSGLIDYFSDFIIMGPSVTTMEAYLSNPGVSLFVGYFAYDSLRNIAKLKTSLRTTPGASHADELFYLFGSKPLLLVPRIPSDIEMIDRMTDFWTNFAKTGTPSANVDIEWPRSENSLKFLKFDKKLKVIDLPNKDRIEFWKRIYERYV